MRSSFVLRGGELRCWRSCLTFLPSVVGSLLLHQLSLLEVDCTVEFHYCQVRHMMEVLGLLVPVCPLCTISVCRWFATSCSFGSPVYCCIQCSKLGYFGSHCKLSGICRGWFQSSCWTISIDTSGKQLGKCARSGMTLPPACQCWPCTWESQVWLGLISAGIWTVAKASVVESIQTSDISIISGSASLLLCLVVSHSLWGVPVEQLRQHQLHHNGGLHQFQLHWPSSVFPPLL